MSPATIVAPLITELENESAATQRLLERVPEKHINWRPHEKSMTLGQLAYHIATVPGDVGSFLKTDGIDADTVDFSPFQPDSLAAIKDAFATSSKAARAELESLTDESAMGNWVLTKGGQEVWSLPRLALARSLMLNHLYHHRGQLTVYLRLLDIPVPATYGRSADENPFG